MPTTTTVTGFSTGSSPTSSPRVTRSPRRRWSRLGRGLGDDRLAGRAGPVPGRQLRTVGQRVRAREIGEPLTVTEPSHPRHGVARERRMQRAERVAGSRCARRRGRRPRPTALRPPKKAVTSVSWDGASCTPAVNARSWVGPSSSAPTPSSVVPSVTSARTPASRRPWASVRRRTRVSTARRSEPSSQPPVGDREHPVRQRHHHRVVGGDDGGDALGLDQPAQQCHHGEAGLGVELTGRLVRDEQPG